MLELGFGVRGRYRVRIWPKINTRQAPNASKNRRWRVYVTASVASWQIKLLRIITMQCSENNSQFLKRFAVSDISE